MGVLIPVGYMQLSFGGQIAGDSEEAVFTFGASEEGAGSETLAADLYEAWADSMELVTSTDFFFRSVTVKHGPTATGATQEFTGGTRQGTISETTVPINTAMLVRKSTALGGRQGRGRAYMCGQIYSGMIGGAGIIDPSELALRQGSVDNFHTAVEAIDGVGQLVLLHSTSSDPDVLTATTVQPKVATQRRRLRP